MSYKGHCISKVEPGSIAEELEIEVGDTLLRINNQEINDVFDYHYLINDEVLTVLIRKANHEEWEIEIEKDYEEDLGIAFDEGLMDQYKSCRNKCIFCFIDQNPEGMRETIYFKDDDARLSFLQGNYITLTNMKMEDIDRIILYKLAPINISVHTTNPSLRCQMLNNRFAGDALEKIERLYEGQIDMNSQVVLCKGVNDGEELDRTIGDLANMLPYMQSLSVVPLGKTKFREGLEDIPSFTAEDAKIVLGQIHKWQERLLKEHGTRFVFASDEWYIKAGLPIPGEEYYEGYGQIENGVGMVRSLIDEVMEYLETIPGDARNHRVSLATGVLASPVIEQLVNCVKEKFPNIDANVFTIRNDFFGHEITVAGLLTGTDIIDQLKGQDLGDYLILPDVLLRSGEEVLLDDLTLKDIQNALQTEIRIVKSDGKSFIDTVINTQ